MNVLIVDDWPDRHSKVRASFKGAEKQPTFICRYGPGLVTDDDLAAADVVFLDHDMCQSEGKTCPSPVEGGSLNFLDDTCGCLTGRDLVTRMLLRTERPRCIVHTANPEGGRVMAQTLHDAGFPVLWSPVTTWSHLAPDVRLRLWKLKT